MHDRVSKAIKITALIVAFLLGAVIAILTVPPQATAKIPLAKPQQKKYRTYRIDFKDKKCGFCGTNAALYYEFSAKADGSAYSEYLCKECREFLRYKTFTNKTERR